MSGAADKGSAPDSSGHAFGVGPGMRLSEAFFHEHVEPLADSRLGRSSYAAALLGGGSDVLGLDTELSADHDWGPRVTLFIDPEALVEASSIDRDLPASFRGVSRCFGATAGGAAWIHPFEVSTVRDYFHAWVGFSDREAAPLLEWLSRPAMSFLAVTAGAVFHDGTGELTRARTAVHWYPDDVWRWLVACQWRRIGEEEPFIERARMVGDALGARVIAARAVREAMRMAFLLERRYAPYSKWLGSAFATLPVSAELLESLTTALDDTGERSSQALCAAFEILGSTTNARLGTGVDPSPRRYFSRPIVVSPAGAFVEAIMATIGDRQLESLPTSAGNVDMLFGTNNGEVPGAVEAYGALLSTPRTTA